VLLNFENFLSFFITLNSRSRSRYCPHKRATKKHNKDDL
jgi:hypothetical protein